jgi:hypothetical protein
MGDRPDGQVCPAAPELAVSADGCNVKLDIHDLSENEEGFGLYRQISNSPEWVHVADLASHSGKGWIETQDSNLSGGIAYYVDAFNSKGQTSSNLALVNIDPKIAPCTGSCSHPMRAAGCRPAWGSPPGIYPTCGC